MTDQVTTAAPKPAFRIQWDRENYLCAVLCQLTKVNVQIGDTTTDSRREHIRRLIAEHSLAAHVVGKKTAQPLTLSEVFERTFGVPLSDAAPQESLF